MISVISPVYSASKILPTLVEEIANVMTHINEDFEIILVDDRSPDDSWEVMLDLARQNPQLKCIRLSRNFGQHPAIIAGLSFAKGDWMVVLDCDMQDHPKEIKKLWQKTKEGFDVILAKRIERKDHFLKRLSSALFYKIFNYLAGIEINNEVANFGIYNKKVISNVLKMEDQIKFFPLFVNWVGFKSTTVSVEHQPRLDGKSSYSLTKLISLALNTIISFSDKPLKLFIGFGASISVFSFFIGCFYLYKYFTNQILERGFSSLIISIWFLSGVIISCIGILGLYLGKTFNQTKSRPIFIIDEIK